MKIGIPKENKNHEYRVGLTPANVAQLVVDGHQIFVETQAGEGAGFSDDSYCNSGAIIAASAQELFAAAEMIVKVKELQTTERVNLREGQILFSYLHLAPDAAQTQDLLDARVTAIAFETITAQDGSLPLLAPMSEIAGRLSIQAGAHCLEKKSGGCGILLGGVPGVPPAKVVILGGGVVGSNAATIAVGMGARVVILDRSLTVLRDLAARFGSRIEAIYSSPQIIEEQLVDAELVVGGVLIPGASAPKLVTREHLKLMRKGSVIVDVAIDQGGCFETACPTTYANPTYIVENVVHYCVANMPGGVPNTSTLSLNNAIFPYVKRLAQSGVSVLRDDADFLRGLNTYQGKITCPNVAKSLNLPYCDPRSLIN